MLMIISNGSKWAGQQPDTIEDLIKVLGEYTLDPTFEDYGSFIQSNYGFTKFFGNFSDLSHVFNIVTDEPEVIKALTNAINANRQTAEYQRLLRSKGGLNMTLQEWINEKLEALQQEYRDARLRSIYKGAMGQYFNSIKLCICGGEEINPETTSIDPSFDRNTLQDREEVAAYQVDFEILKPRKRKYDRVSFMLKAI